MPSPERRVIETLLNIVDKEGNDVPFILNPHQALVDDHLEKRNIIPKPRQEGISSYILALFTIRALSNRNTNAVIISHDRESTQKLLERVHYYLKTMRGPKPTLGVDSKNTITFPKLNSKITIATQGTKDYGRGDTISDLHCSEVAIWDDPKKQAGAVFQAVRPNGTIFLESTGNGIGDWYHKRVLSAIEGKSAYKLHFPDWRLSSEYSLDCSPEMAQEVMANLDESLEEPKYVNEFNLTVGQILWRRLKLEEMDYDLSLFKQEYPLTVHECFQGLGGAFFHRINHVTTNDWIKHPTDSNFHYHKQHYDPNLNYVLGVDIAAGVGGDYSVIEVICAETNQQVAEFRSNEIPPDEFAQIIEKVGNSFNYPLVVVESNNHGVLTLNRLKEVYPRSKIYRDSANTDNIVGYGFRTTSKTRPVILGDLRADLVRGLVIHSDILHSELTTFVENENTGKLEAQQGCHDDCIMAFAMANVGCKKVWRYIENEENNKKMEYKPHFLSFEGIVDSMRTENQYPVSDQLKW